MLAASEVEAVKIALLVFELTDDVIPDVWVLVFALMFAASDVDAFTSAEFKDEVAVVMSDRVASEPEVRFAPVRVRVAEDQTSSASDPSEVNVRVPAAQTLVGIAVIADAN